MVEIGEEKFKFKKLRKKVLVICKKVGILTLGDFDTGEFQIWVIFEFFFANHIWGNFEKQKISNFKKNLGVGSKQ